MSGRDPDIEARLLRWAQWLKVGDGSGYPVTSVLHPSWQPPSPGVTPTLKTGGGAGDVRQTGRMISRLSARLQQTVRVHYVKALPLAQQAAELQCAERTVQERIVAVHRMLRAMLAEPKASPADDFLQHAPGGVQSARLGAN